MEALLSSLLSTSFLCGSSDILATRVKLEAMRHGVLKTQCLRIQYSSAGEKARIACSAEVRGRVPSDLDSDMSDQSTAQQVTELKERPGRGLTRRALFAPPLAAATLFVSPSLAGVTVENRAPSGNFLLRGFGIGDPDIYYPRFFEGTWTCYSTLIAVETPQGEDKIDVKAVEQARKRIGYTTTYQARFVPFEGYVVCDRLFTTVSLVESLIGRNTVEHGTWDPRQPNRLELILRGGPKVENTVTKRSAGMFSPYEFESAEFSRQVLDNFSRQDGPPTVKVFPSFPNSMLKRSTVMTLEDVCRRRISSISVDPYSIHSSNWLCQASQNLTRYQWDMAADEVNKIEAIQKVSMYAVPKEGRDFEGLEIFNTNSPTTVYKYRITFKKEGL